MKAAVVTEFGPADNIQYTDVPMPAIGERQVLIRVRATSINFADIKSRYGRYHGGTQPPFIPGLDAAGVIEALGSGVRSLTVGQRVIAFPDGGSYAEYVVADEDLTFVFPDALDFEVAAASPIASFTAYKLLADVGRLSPGETVVVHSAAGGVGTTAVQLARILGASQVIGTVGSDAKRSLALAAGADTVVSYAGPEFAQQVLDLTHGRGADVILDSVGGWVSELSLDCLARYGRLVHFGSSSGEVGTFRTADLHASCRSVLGFSLGTTRRERPELLAPVAEKVFTYLADGRLKMQIGARFPLFQAAEAQRFIESRQSTGKVILTLEV